MHAGSGILIFYKGIHLQEGTDYTRSDSQITLSNSIAISTGDTNVDGNYLSTYNKY